MKKILLASLFMIIAVLCISTANATVSANTFSSSTPTFGSSSQQASNPNADEEADENIYVNSTSIILSSNVSTAVNVSSISYTYASGLSLSDLSLSYGSLPTGITNTTNGTLILRARVSEKVDAVDNDGDPVAIKVADAVLTLSDSNTITIPLYMQRENKLEIDKVLVSINGGSLKSYSSSGKTVDVERTDDVEIQVKIENKYDESDDDVKIEDITVNGDFGSSSDIAEDEDDVEDIDEDASDLDSEEDDTVDLMTFEVHEEADADYDAKIYVVGDDEHGARHGEKWDITFDVEVETHDLRLTKAELSPSEVSCSRTSTLRVTGINLGKRDEDDVRITVTNSALSLEQQKDMGDIENDEDDNDFSASFTITVNDSVKAGTYPIYVRLYRDVDELDYTMTSSLIVKACTAAATTSTSSTTTSSSTTSSTSTATSAADEGEETGTSTETSFFESPAYNGLLIGVNVIAIIAVIAVAITFLKPKP